MCRPSSVSDRAGIVRRRWPPSPAGIAILLLLAACACPASADPLSTPPLGGEEHGQFFDSLELLDPATAALPPLPARVPATPLKQDDGSAPEPPTGPVAETWMWQLTSDPLAPPRQGPPPVREQPPASGWARIVGKATPILLAAGALMALAALMTLAQRR